MKLRTFAFALVLIPALQQQSCQQMVDPQVLQKSREFFPKAYIQKCFPDILHIETRVGNVTPEFGAKVMQALLQGEEGRKLQTGMQIGNYRWISLGFDDFNILWENGSPQFEIVTPHDAVQWMSTHGKTPPPSGSCTKLE